jgi:hypothetical protein
MKRFKKLLCITLALAMVISTSVTAFASGRNIAAYNMIILEDSDNQRVVQTSDNNFTYITTYNKVNNTIQFTVVDQATNSENIGAVVSVDDYSVMPIGARASINENTFTNYEYTKIYGNPNEWELRRPDGSLAGTYYFKTYEATQNQSYLNAFKSAVDTINTKEGEIVGTYGLQILSILAAAAAGAGAIFTGGILTAAAWGSILAAAGATTAHIAVVMAWDRACKNAYDAYFETYTKSPIVFY